MTTTLSIAIACFIAGFIAATFASEHTLPEKLAMARLDWENDQRVRASDYQNAGDEFDEFAVRMTSFDMDTKDGYLVFKRRISLEREFTKVLEEWKDGRGKEIFCTDDHDVEASYERIARRLRELSAIDPDYEAGQDHGGAA